MSLTITRIHCTSTGIITSVGSDSGDARHARQARWQHEDPPHATAITGIAGFRLRPPPGPPARFRDHGRRLVVKHSAGFPPLDDFSPVILADIAVVNTVVDESAQCTEQGANITWGWLPFNASNGGETQRSAAHTHHARVFVGSFIKRRLSSDTAAHHAGTHLDNSEPGHAGRGHTRTTTVRGGDAPLVCGAMPGCLPG